MRRGWSWTALSVVLVACAQVGCPKSGPTAAERKARREKARKARKAELEARREREAERLESLGKWPPSRGESFPDMGLFDTDGKEVKLSSFRGKVILLQWVAVTSPGSISLAGGSESGAYQGTEAQAGLSRLDETLQKIGVPVDSPDFVWLQVMVYGPGEAAPTQADAQAWAKHFKLAERPRTHVLYADQRYQVEPTYTMVPDFLVIDPDFNLAFNCTKLPEANSWPRTVRGLKQLLEARAVLPAYNPTVSPRVVRLLALATLLKEGKHSELDAEVAKLLAQGYRKDAPGRTHLDAISDLGSVEGVTEAHFAAWVAAAPESFVPSYLKGEAHVKWGWDARGSGYANTVTEEGWEIFGRELQKAKESYTLANRISSTQAYGYTGLLIVARALRASDEVREAYFAAAIKADPDYLSAYEMKLEAIYPKWGGSAKAALEFVYGSIEARPDYLPLETLVPRLHYEFSRTVFNDGAAYLSRKRVVSDCVGAIRRIREAYPESRQINRLALKIAKRRKVGVLEAAKLLAEQGDPWGMGQYGFYLKWGRQGAKIDLEKAHEFLLASGQAGDMIGAGQIAQSLIYHPGFKHDYARAIPWLKASAEAGYDFAQELLGDSYFLGRGVAKDLPRAAAWYRRADNASARKELSKLLAEEPKLRRPGDPE